MRRRQSHRGLTTSRIYPKGKRFYYFSPTPVQNPVTGKVAKWHSLCLIADGEDRARELMRAFKGVAPKTRGKMPRLMEEYRIDRLKRKEKRRPKEPAREAIFKAASDEFTRICGKIADAFEDFDLDQVLPADVAKFVDQWAGQRMGEVYHARLSDFFEWACRRGDATRNPVKDVKVEKAPKRDRLLTPAEFHAIRDALLIGLDGRATPSGPMIQCYVDLCFLLYQRTTEIRLLKWSDVDMSAGLIYFKPTKTEASSGAKVAVPISPAVRDVLERAKQIGVVKSMYVIHTLRGQPYTSRGIGDAWERARDRAKVTDATLKDIRSMAATAAKRAGYEVKQISVGLAHTSQEMTDEYIRLRETPVSEVVLRLPEKPRAA